MTPERLQKILARAGYGSRRACEKLIEEGRVMVDGKLARLGDGADPQTQKIAVDGETLRYKPPTYTYIMLHKPQGVLSTVRDPHGRRTVLDLVRVPERIYPVGRLDYESEGVLSTVRDPHGRRTVLDLVRVPERIYPVGRLDYESEGLILLTNDGDLVQRLTHPRYEHPRVYRALISGEPTAETLERWRRGIVLDGRPARFDKVEIESQTHGETWLRITVHEGRNHLVRRVAAALGHPVLRLIRVEMGPLKLGDLVPGRWRPLTAGEVKLLTGQRVPRPERRADSRKAPASRSRNSARASRPSERKKRRP